MPWRIFLAKITKDKYRNEIITKFQKRSTYHMIQALLEDWSTLKLHISVISERT